MVGNFRTDARSVDADRRIIVVIVARASDQRGQDRDPGEAEQIGVMPKPDDAAIGAATGSGSAAGTGGGTASITGSTHPPAGAWAVAAALAATVVDDVPHKAVAEACEPKMLSATIGLIVRAGAATAEADASAGVVVSASATPTEIIFLDTPPSIFTLPIQERSHR